MSQNSDSDSLDTIGMFKQNASRLAKCGSGSRLDDDFQSVGRSLQK